MLFMVLYVWSRKDPYRQVAFWGFAFQAWHFPFVLLVVGMLLGGNPILDLVGIVVGHVFHFLTDIVPVQYHTQLLSTPQFLYQLYEGGNVAGRSQGWQRTGGHRLG